MLRENSGPTNWSQRVGYLVSMMEMADEWEEPGDEGGRF